MWEFYLAVSEMAFREGAMVVFQLQLTKRQDVVPMTRDYIAREEARLRALEGGGRPPLRLAGEQPPACTPFLSAWSSRPAWANMDNYSAEGRGQSRQAHRPEATHGP